MGHHNTLDRGRFRVVRHVATQAGVLALRAVIIVGLSAALAALAVTRRLQPAYAWIRDAQLA
jgi:hypothetical protein